MLSSNSCSTPQPGQIILKLLPRELHPERSLLALALIPPQVPIGKSVRVLLTLITRQLARSLGKQPSAMLTKPLRKPDTRQERNAMPSRKHSQHRVDLLVKRHTRPGLS